MLISVEMCLILYVICHESDLEYLKIKNICTSLPCPLSISVFFLAVIGAIKTGTRSLLLQHPVWYGQANLQTETISYTLHRNFQNLTVYVLFGCR